MRKLLLTIIIGFVLLGACASPSAPPEPIPAPLPKPIPVPSPTPTPAPTPELTIPRHFTTYTDEVNIFSISYPPDWEPALSEIERLEQSTEEVIRSIEWGTHGEMPSLIFAAGIPTLIGYDPNVVISVEPSSFTTVDAFAEASIRGIKIVAQEYREVSRTKTIIGGREAVIVDYGFIHSNGEKYRGLNMLMLVDRVGWTITCQTYLEKFDDFESDFHAIIRSLRIMSLQPIPITPKHTELKSYLAHVETIMNEATELALGIVSLYETALELEPSEVTHGCDYYCSEYEQLLLEFDAIECPEECLRLRQYMIDFLTYRLAEITEFKAVFSTGDIEHMREAESYYDQGEEALALVIGEWERLEHWVEE